MDALTPDVLASPAVGILNGLERDGFRIVVKDDGAVSITPKSRLTSDRMTMIAAHRDSLRLLIRSYDAGVQERRLVFQRQKPAGPFVFASCPYVAGRCYSCGDPLPRPMFGACWRCNLARRLACSAPIPEDLATALDAAKVIA